MKPLTFLEVGNLGGLVAMIVMMIIGISLVIAFVLTFIIKAVYESKDNRKYSTKQYMGSYLPHGARWLCPRRQFICFVKTFV